MLKIFLTFFQKWLAWKADERLKFEERMRNMANILKEASGDSSEAINEEDYLANLNWELKKRYDLYKKETFKILMEGGGIIELKSVISMGMGKRIEERSDKVIEILRNDKSLNVKARMISKILIES